MIMEALRLSDDELERLIEEGEGHRVEFKETLERRGHRE